MMLQVLGGGATQSLVTALAPPFQADRKCEIKGNVGAVGAMRDSFLSGHPADVLILTAPIIAELTRSGHIQPGSAADIGAVGTGIAVRAGDEQPIIGDAEKLRAAIAIADEVHFPDPKLATAGIHFMTVLERLDLADSIKSRLFTHPNGATAMRALAESRSVRPIGCTQITEILNTRGIMLVGAFPKGCELTTIYTAAVTARSPHPELARAFVETLSSAASVPLRRRLGFEV